MICSAILAHFSESSVTWHLSRCLHFVYFAYFDGHFGDQPCLAAKSPFAFFTFFTCPLLHTHSPLFYFFSSA